MSDTESEPDQPARRPYVPKVNTEVTMRLRATLPELTAWLLQLGAHGIDVTITHESPQQEEPSGDHSE